MAKGGGGSWKVAYADFVTAMMAFFLVMWIGAQDTKTRQSVANYFVDPSGASKKPVTPGSVMDTMTYGSTPSQEKTAMNQGRHDYSKPDGERSTPTYKVTSWLHNNEKRLRQWKDQARATREAAAKSPEVLQEGKSADEVAEKKLADQLRLDFSAGMSGNPDNVYRDLLFAAIDEVNWKQISQDLLAK